MPTIGVRESIIKYGKAYAVAPKFYLRRRGNDNWTECEWGALAKHLTVAPQTWADAEKMIDHWNQQSARACGDWQYKLPLHCERCFAIVSETWPGLGLPYMLGKHVCSTCHNEGVENMKQQKVGPRLVTRKEGEIWKLPKSNSPMWTEQWGYQGSSKVPYIVSHNPQKVDGSTTPDGWACSCPNFTRNTPRTPCKHILNVRLKEGYVDLHTKPAAKLANVDKDKLAAFEAWEREQAAAKKQGPAQKSKLNLFGETGRKFR